MKIIVCIKQVPGTTQVEIDEKTGVLKRSAAAAKMNPYDLYAIETALRLKEEYGAVTAALTMGPPYGEAVLREAMMMGIDDGILLTDRTFGGADCLATSYALSQAIRSVGIPDLILCGKQTTDGDTAQVGAELSEALELPCLTNVLKIEEVTDEKLTVEELAALKKAALSSPTAMNRQNQRFIFVTGENKLAELEKGIFESILAKGDPAFVERMKARGGRVTYNAPLVVIICAAPGHFARVDAGIAVENIALAAKSMGLDSVILGMPEGAFAGEEGRAMRESFAFPDGYEFCIAISVGHRAMDKDPHEWDESHIIEL